MGASLRPGYESAARSGSRQASRNLFDSILRRPCIVKRGDAERPRVSAGHESGSARHTPRAPASASRCSMHPTLSSSGAVVEATLLPLLWELAGTLLGQGGPLEMRQVSHEELFDANYPKAAHDTRWEAPAARLSARVELGEDG